MQKKCRNQYLNIKNIDFSFAFAYNITKGAMQNDCRI